MREFKKGDILVHFKRQYINDKTDPTYTYEYLGTAIHTETRETLVIYKALYGDQKIYARPYQMFMSEVDKEKYPDIKAKYRFDYKND